MAEAIPILPPSRVLVAGGTGFLGGHVVKALLGRGYRVRCLVRPQSVAKLAAQPALSTVVGNVEDAESVSRAAAGCQAAVNLVGIIAETAEARYEKIHLEGARNLVAACVAQGVRRLIHVSALGARGSSASRFFRTKWEGEEVVRGSSLAYTIFRPSVIHGAGGALAQMLARLARLPVLMPIPGAGDGLLQPVMAEEVAWLIAESLSLPRTAGHSYDVGGAELRTLEGLLQAVSQVVNGKRRRVARVPLWLLRAAAYAAEKGMRRPMLTRGQLELLSEVNVCSLAPLRADFGFRPRGLEEALRSYMGKSA